MSLRWPRDTIALVAATMRKMGLTVGPASRVRRAAMNEALDHLDGPFARDPSKAATRAFERACRLLETGDLRSAEALSTRAIKLGYANNQTYTVRAVARLGRGRYRLAVADLDETLRRDPGRVELLRMRATAFSNLDLAARADDDFSAVLAQTPDDAEAWSFRGIVRAAQGRLAEAEADFKQAERRGCLSVAMDQWRVYVLSRLGRLKRARALLQRARKADPRAALTLRVEGDVHMAAGNYEDAVVAYRRALTRRRGAEFRFALALALLKTGRKPEARRTFAVARRQARPSDLDEARREANHWLSSADERQEVLDALTVSPGRATRAVATG
jgi:tetratricopeptide (TPR) repeat protein